MFNLNEIAIVGPVTTDPTDRRSHYRGAIILKTEQVRGRTEFTVEELLTGLVYPVDPSDLHSVESWERHGSPALATMEHRFSHGDH